MNLDEIIAKLTKLKEEDVIDGIYVFEGNHLLKAKYITLQSLRANSKKIIVISQAITKEIMNLVEVATWIQEGYAEFYTNPHIKAPYVNAETYALYYVMRKGKGHLNPATIKDLIALETSVPDPNGMNQC